jgi:hypothetical protein
MYLTWRLGKLAFGSSGNKQYMRWVLSVPLDISCHNRGGGSTAPYAFASVVCGYSGQHASDSDAYMYIPFDCQYFRKCVQGLSLGVWEIRRRSGKEWKKILYMKEGVYPAVRWTPTIPSCGPSPSRKNACSVFRTVSPPHPSPLYIRKVVLMPSLQSLNFQLIMWLTSHPLILGVSVPPPPSWAREKTTASKRAISPLPFPRPIALTCKIKFRPRLLLRQYRTGTSHETIAAKQGTNTKRIRVKFSHRRTLNDILASHTCSQTVQI